ncbi:hypothetical protein BB561_003518 [Smittium simulii]|uniref:Uncharacterized protein n=1 Tax=Smittium simulii TaxID=133385 RepID=A0A2T9YL18_9FUNG|nr:hypothetical protein BB561_003518 [Smittium simulii]
MSKNATSKDAKILVSHNILMEIPVVYDLAKENNETALKSNNKSSKSSSLESLEEHRRVLLNQSTKIKSKFNNVYYLKNANNIAKASDLNNVARLETKIKRLDLEIQRKKSQY